MKVSDEGILIDMADIDAFENDIKPGSRLYQAISTARCLKRQMETILPSGVTVREFNQMEDKILLQEVDKFFTKNLPFPYHDYRSMVHGFNFFINAMPDGSEYLMRMDIENNERKMVTIQQVTPKGQGQYFLRLYEK